MRTILAALAVLLLASCQETPPPPPPEPLRFDGPTYTLNVSGISVAQDYKSPRRPPNVEYLADISPAQAVQQWAGVRLVAAGHANSMEVDVKNASIVRKDLPKQKTGIEGMFTTEQTEEYEGALEVELKIYTAKSVLPTARINVAARQKLSLPENATPFDRERLYHRMTLALMKAIAPELDANIHRYLAGYLL